jgi:NADH:ubiquinone oxidoreductase subunit C
MTDSTQDLAAHVQELFGAAITDARQSLGELTLEVRRDDIIPVCTRLRDDPALAFVQLMDVCGVDYLEYGRESTAGTRSGPRFAVVYHLLSLKYNRRIRLRAWLDDEMPLIASVTGIWNCANWYEREAFDLFGIVFEGIRICAAFSPITVLWGTPSARTFRSSARSRCAMTPRNSASCTSRCLSNRGYWFLVSFAKKDSRRDERVIEIGNCTISTVIPAKRGEAGFSRTHLTCVRAAERVQRSVLHPGQQQALNGSRALPATQNLR